MSVKPTRRYSYWVFLLIGAIATTSAVLPSLKDAMSDWVYAALVIAGIICQHINQEIKRDDETSEGR